jgi:hypothetical protein
VPQGLIANNFAKIDIQLASNKQSMASTGAFPFFYKRGGMEEERRVACVAEAKPPHLLVKVKRIES